jgi:hypothetical protein
VASRPAQQADKKRRPDALIALFAGYNAVENLDIDRIGFFCSSPFDPQEQATTTQNQRRPQCLPLFLIPAFTLKKFPAGT